AKVSFEARAAAWAGASAATDNTTSAPCAPPTCHTGRSPTGASSERCHDEMLTYSRSLVTVLETKGGSTPSGGGTTASAFAPSSAGRTIDTSKLRWRTDGVIGSSGGASSAGTVGTLPPHRTAKARFRAASSPAAGSSTVVPNDERRAMALLRA